MRLRTIPLALIAALASVAGAAQDRPGAGTLTACLPDGNVIGVCPLEHTDAQAAISGTIARVTVTQRFKNTFEEPIEAIYTFPLSAGGAVDRMTMKIGARTIAGVVKEREAARREYEAARNAGQAASLLDQERPNIFTQSVANILPGEAVEIEISYVEHVKYEEGRYTFSFPMTVGPRYMPQSVSAADAARISPPVTPEGQRAGHDISLSVGIDAGARVADLQSELHEVESQVFGNGTAQVQLKNQKEIPNRDFVLHYTVPAEAIQDAVLVHRDERGGFFSLLLYPPERVAPEISLPKEMIFVIDCSGSMHGFPLEKAKQTMRQAIEGMNPDDTFNLVSFAGGTGYCFESPVPNTRENVNAALKYLSNLQGGGGTEMMGAVRAALAGPYAEERLRVVCFMTDGFIGNDMEILGEIRDRSKNARVFSFGIGNGVNTFLIEHMALEGRGASEIVTLESDSDAAVKRFHERIQHPVLRDIQIDFGGLAVEDVLPEPTTVPDLFSASPLVITGRYTHAGSGTVTVRGTTSTGAWERKIQLELPEAAPEHDVLASLWARRRVDTLMREDWRGMQTGSPREGIKKEVTQLGTEFQIMTQFTSFVAVEEKVVNEGGRLKTVQVPIELTDGVSHEGIFGERMPSAARAGVMVGRAKGAPVAGGAPPRALLNRAQPRPRAVAPAAPPASVPAQAMEPEADALAVRQEAKASESDEAGAKLAPELQGLAQKLQDGAFTSGTVKVRGGQVEVHVHLASITEDALAALKAAGADVIATLRSRGVVLARVPVEKLEALAALEVVVRITPPEA